MSSEIGSKDKEVQIATKGFFGFSKDVADLLLLHDNSQEWIAEPRVRRAWHWMFFSIIMITVWNYVGLPVLYSLDPPRYENSETMALIMRCIFLATSVFLIVLLLWLAYTHFFYLILTGRDLRLKPIAFFLTAGILLFSYLHFAMYRLFPSFYAYPSSPIKILPVLAPLGPIKYQVLFDFFVYSACTTLTLSSPVIKASSSVVAALEVTQALLSLILFSLLLASIIQNLSGQDQQRNAP